MNKFFKKLNQRTALEFSSCNQEGKVFLGKMEMLLLLEVHTEKQESKMTGCNQCDKIGYMGKLFDGASGAQLKQGTKEVWGSRFVEIFKAQHDKVLSCCL